MNEKNKVIGCAKDFDTFCEVIEHENGHYSLFWGEDKGRTRFVNVSSLQRLVCIGEAIKEALAAREKPNDPKDAINGKVEEDI